MKDLIVILMLTLTACTQGVKNSQPAPPESAIISCEDYYSHITSLGVLTNNVWNKQAAAGERWQQCLVRRQVADKTQYGWSWSWPNGRRVIYSQPQLKIGSSPWAPEPKFDDAFPLTISELESLDISHSLEIETNGDLNTATTLWLIKEPYKGVTPTRSIIAAEVMYWTYATKGHMNPAGSKVSEVTIEGGAWEVWYQQNWEDKSGANDNKWRYISFRGKESSMQAKIPALELLTYAITQNLLPKGLYIADIELGNEIMSGEGLTWVQDFHVEYTTKP